MAHTKAQGSSSNGRDSHGQRLGVKRYGSQYVNAGEIILKQRGTRILPGVNVSRASDDSLFARKSGIVTFEWAKRGKQQVSVYPFTGKRHQRWNTICSIPARYLQVTDLNIASLQKFIA